MAESSVVCKSIEYVACQLFCPSFHSTAGRNRVFAIRTGSNEEDEHYNLEKISFNRLSDGSSDATGEGELGEGC
jgi:hypothetical protein